MLRAVLVGVSPIVARVLTVPDRLTLEELHEVLLLLLGWESHKGGGHHVHRVHDTHQLRSSPRRGRDRAPRPQGDEV